MNARNHFGVGQPGNIQIGGNAIVGLAHMNHTQAQGQFQGGIRLDMEQAGSALLQLRFWITPTGNGALVAGK